MVLVDSDIDDINDGNKASSRNLILFEIITPGSYIVLRSLLGALFRSEAVTKDVATDYIADTNDHRILPGECYVTQFLK